MCGPCKNRRTDRGFLALLFSRYLSLSIGGLPAASLLLMVGHAHTALLTLDVKGVSLILHHPGNADGHGQGGSHQHDLLD